MTPVQRRDALRRLIAQVLPSLDDLTPQGRADAYDGIAAAAWCVDHQTMDAAEAAAKALREAEAHQLKFNLLVKEVVE